MNRGDLLILISHFVVVVIVVAIIIIIITTTTIYYLLVCAINFSLEIKLITPHQVIFIYLINQFTFY